jgi:hypothetical protein
MVTWQVSRCLYAVKTPDDAGLLDPVQAGTAAGVPPDNVLALKRENEVRQKSLFGAS